MANVPDPGATPGICLVTWPRVACEILVLFGGQNDQKRALLEHFRALLGPFWGLFEADFLTKLWKLLKYRSKWLFFSLDRPQWVGNVQNMYMWTRNSSFGHTGHLFPVIWMFTPFFREIGQISHCVDP